MKPEECTYEVYFATSPDFSEMLYTGSGKKGRHKHLTSGISSVLEATDDN